MEVRKDALIIEELTGAMCYNKAVASASHTAAFSQQPIEPNSLPFALFTLFVNSDAQIETKLSEETDATSVTLAAPAPGWAPTGAPSRERSDHRSVARPGLDRPIEDP